MFRESLTFNGIPGNVSSRFAEAAGFSHLGIAFCIGLAEEARTYKDFLDKRFRVSSVCCKVCGIPKSRFSFNQICPDASGDTQNRPLRYTSKPAIGADSGH